MISIVLWHVLRFLPLPLHVTCLVLCWRRLFPDCIQHLQSIFPCCRLSALGLAPARIFSFPEVRDKRAYTVGGIGSWLSVLSQCRSKRVSRLSWHGKYVRVALMKPTLSLLRVSCFSLREDQCSLLKRGCRGGWNVTFGPNNNPVGLQNDSFIRKLALQGLVLSWLMVSVPISFDCWLSLLCGHQWNSSGRSHSQVRHGSKIQALSCGT